MKKIFALLFLSFLISVTTFSQCPVLRASLINSCSSGAGEGLNEYVVFTTTVAAPVSSYDYKYRNTAPTNSPTGFLVGANAGAKSGTGTVATSGGCTIVEITSPSQVIPANSTVVYLSAAFDQNYDLSGLCTTGTIYVAYITIGTNGAVWPTNGVQANSGTGARYMQLAYQGTDCDIHTYTPSSLVGTDGAMVWWDAGVTDASAYTNNGCTTPVPPTPTTTITPSAIAAVCAGTTSTTMAYTATGSPDVYSITWDNAAITAGFTNVTNATLTASPLTITIPTGATAGTYTGSLVATNTSNSTSSTAQNISVTINAGSSSSITLTSATGTNTQIKCVNSAITDITYSITGGTPSVTGLPQGVTGNFNAGVFTISGTPTTAGSFNYTLSLSGASCGGTSIAVGSITVSDAPAATITTSKAPVLCQNDSVTLSTIESSNAGNALQFTGSSNQYVDPQILPNFYDNFTFEMWVNPTTTITLQTQNTSGASGTSGQHYALFPTWGGGNANGATDAGAGVSVGTNGIAVYEHGAAYLPALLVWNHTVTGWTHIAVVYTNKQPSLYVNGVLVATGLTSLRTHVYPSLGHGQNFSGQYGGIGGGYYGSFTGQIDEFRLWKTVRTGNEIATDYNKSIALPNSDLFAYYKFDEGTGTTTADASSNGFTGALTNGPTWVIPSGAPLGAYSYLWTPNGETTSSITVHSAGTYTVTVTNAAGCSKTISQVVQNITAVEKDTALTGCTSVTYGPTTYTSSTTVRDTVKSTGGCDSVYIVASITIQGITPVSKDSSLSGCNSVDYGLNTYTSSTNFKDTIRSVGGCDSVYINVSISVTPFNVTIAASNNPADKGSSVTVIASGNPNTFTVSSWEPAAVFTSQSALNQTFTADTSMLIKVTASSNGCADTATLALKVNPVNNADDFYIPDVFSPNNDGKNDVFRAYGSNIKIGQMKIYNQWGELLFESRNIEFGWDGTYRGRTQPVGVYVYVITATMNNGKTINSKGFFNLIR
ncbi:T9SS type B sorting domain-containing protein [Ferruginibacter albus]|uniref:T9SS type B sorting domain-containing protein n=1 Tax=Ferruginibacter albus TaxID=2875540 RepID=UPI001CC33D72|nr:gliding motility-associated C-terminal domain-containing protein [Ferruginibacter albus]UAY51318.1 gliding motility-associated C-terminal domain-containing protein [Ferruginibacter albus]